MAGFADIVKKAFYLGIGLAAYAGEQASSKVLEIQSRAQKLAEEMVSRGEMTTEEASQWVNDLVNQAATPPPETANTSEPRRIEILSGDDQLDGTHAVEVEELRNQVLELQAELRRLKRD